MMETKRNKEWRRKHTFRVWRNRVKVYASWTRYWIMDDGSLVYNPHWFELMKCRWARVYKTTGTPCSCPLCSGEHYNRRAYKKETRRIIAETMD